MGTLNRDLKPASSCKQSHCSLFWPCFAMGFHPARLITNNHRQDLRIVRICAAHLESWGLCMYLSVEAGQRDLHVDCALWTVNSQQQQDNHVDCAFWTVDSQQQQDNHVDCAFWTVVSQQQQDNHVDCALWTVISQQQRDNHVDCALWTVIMSTTKR